MPRQEGLRPIGESVKKIIEKIKKEREERQKKSSSPRTQPKLPGMVKGGDVKGYMSGGFGIFSKKKSDKKESNESKKKKRLEELKKEIGMKRGGGVDMGDPKKPVAIPTGKDPEIMVHNLRPSDDPDFRAYAAPRRTGKDKIEKLKADLKKKPKLPGLKRGGGVDTTTSPSVMELANAIKDKDILTKADIERAKKRLMPGRSTPQAITSRKSIKDFMEERKKMQEKKMSNDKVKESLREISARNMAIGGITEDDDEFSRRRKKLSGGQKKLDVNKDGTISGKDFKILRGKQNKMKGGGIAIKGTNFKGVF